MDFLQAATSPSVRPPKRSRGDGTNKSLEEQVEELTQHMQKLSQVVVAHDSSLRELEDWSTHTWLLAVESELSQMLMGQMDAWKGKLQQGQPHPDGPARLTLGAVLAKWILDDASRKAACPHFSILHDKMEGLADMQKSVQLAFAKPIKDGRILLKIRPQMAYQSEWNETFAVLDGLECSERKTVAPPGALVRDLRRR